MVVFRSTILINHHAFIYDSIFYLWYSAFIYNIVIIVHYWLMQWCVYLLSLLIKHLFLTTCSTMLPGCHQVPGPLAWSPFGVPPFWMAPCRAMSGLRWGKQLRLVKMAWNMKKNTLFHEHWRKIINQLILDVFNVSILLVCAMTCWILL